MMRHAAPRYVVEPYFCIWKVRDTFLRTDYSRHIVHGDARRAADERNELDERMKALNG